MARSAAATNIGVDQPPLAEGIAPTIPTWRSVFAGVAIGVAAMMLLSVLWFALAFGSGWMQVRTELDWYLGGSGIFAMFVAGLTAAYLSGVRGTGSGVVHGTTVWATGVIFALVVGVPSVAGLIGLSPGELGVTEAGSIDPRDAAWPVFMSLLGRVGRGGVRWVHGRHSDPIR